MDKDREIAMLRGTLREMLRIAEAADSDTESVGPSDGLEGQLANQWRSIVRKAKVLVGP